MPLDVIVNQEAISSPHRGGQPPRKHKLRFSKWWFGGDKRQKFPINLGPISSWHKRQRQLFCAGYKQPYIG